MAKCIGCGIKLQTHDENLAGYVPLLVSADLGDNVYCKRCYQIIHNGKRYNPEISDNDYYQKISVIKDQKAIVVLMIDIMDIYGGFIPNLHKYIGDNQVIIVVNKDNYIGFYDYALGRLFDYKKLTNLLFGDFGDIEIVKEV